MIIQGMNSILHGVAPLPHLGVIAVTGEDAAKFLHGQLTQDFVLLPDGQARLAAFCSAQGRMQASFVALKRSDADILLICSRDLIERTVKRLSMFVLRAKAKLRDASGEFELRGLLGNAAVTQAQAPWKVEQQGEATLIHLHPAQGLARALWLAPAGTTTPDMPALDEGVWRWSEVMSGVAWVSAPVFEAFVPQMLNYESTDGVNFKKGCYPGQEVVARSQFRGAIKRRAHIVHCDAEMQAGQEIYDAADAEQPCGIVAQAAAMPAGQGSGFDAIAVLQTASINADLRLGAADGPKLALQPLPYALREDI